MNGTAVMLSKCSCFLVINLYWLCRDTHKQVCGHSLDAEDEADSGSIGAGEDRGADTNAQRKAPASNIPATTAIHALLVGFSPGIKVLASPPALPPTAPKWVPLLAPPAWSSIISYDTRLLIIIDDGMRCYWCFVRCCCCCCRCMYLCSAILRSCVASKTLHLCALQYDRSNCRG